MPTYSYRIEKPEAKIGESVDGAGPFGPPYTKIVAVFNSSAEINAASIDELGDVPFENRSNGYTLTWEGSINNLRELDTGQGWFNVRATEAGTHHGGESMNQVKIYCAHGVYFDYGENNSVEDETSNPGSINPGKLFKID